MADTENVAQHLVLVRRGKRLGAEGEAADYEWWQELPEGQDPDALRSVGYEVRTMVPASQLDKYREAIHEALALMEDDKEPEAYTLLSDLLNEAPERSTRSHADSSPTEEER